MKRTATILAGAVIGTLIVGAGPAAAEELHIDAPERVTVNQTYTDVPWTLSGPDAHLMNRGAAVTLVHVNTGREVAYSGTVADAPTMAGVLAFYDPAPMGRYEVRGNSGYYHGCMEPGCFDFDVEAASDYIVVKRDARAVLDAHRDGRRVTLTALAKRYEGRYRLWTSDWTRHDNAKVVFQRKTSTGWTRIAADTTNSRGIATAVVKRGQAAKYRAVVKATGAVWGDTSRTISK